MSKSEQELNKINAGLSKSDKFLESMAQKAQTIFNSLRAGSSAMSGTGASSTVMDTPSFAGAQPPTPPRAAAGASNKIMDTPVYNVGPITMGGPINPGGPMPPMGTPGASGPSFGQQVGQGIINYGLPALGLAYGSLPNVSQGMEQQLLTSRARFYSGLPEEEILRIQTQLANRGTIMDPMSASRAIAMGQSMGISPGLSNFEDIMSGVADFSNLVPGMDVTGGMQAAVALNQARNVNMLKLLGVNVRDPQTGLMNSPPEVVEQLWRRLTAGRRPPTQEEIAFSLQPGNRLDVILNTYFGNSEELKAAARSLFLQKASGGTLDIESLDKTGATTPAVQSLSGRFAKAFGIIRETADESAAGAAAGNELIGSISELITSNTLLRNSIEALAGIRGFVDTISGTPAGAAATAGVSNLFVRGIQSIFKIPARQLGGKAQAGKPYLVGEQGPEVVVPDQASIVIPNNLTIKNGLDKDEWAVAFLHNIKAPATETNIQALRKWMAHEGGHYNNSAAYNPLNTSFKTANSRGMSAKNQLVQAYGDWREGLFATIATLTGKSAGERGYSDIIGAFQSGRPLDEILNTINASAWVTGKTGGRPYKFGNTGASVYRDGASTNISLLSEEFGNRNSLMGGSENILGISSGRRSVFAPYAVPNLASQQASSATSSGAINYGGVNVTINVPQGANINSSDLVAELQKALGNDNIMNQLGAS